MTTGTEPDGLSLIERDGEGAFEMDLHESGASSTVQWYFRESSELPVGVSLWRLPPGGCEGMHTHEGDLALEELYVVVSGTAEAGVGGVRHTLTVGDAYSAPPGVPHDLKNIGDDELRVIVVWGETVDRSEIAIHNPSWAIVKAAVAARRHEQAG